MKSKYISLVYPPTIRINEYGIRNGSRGQYCHYVKKSLSLENPLVAPFLHWPNLGKAIQMEYFVHTIEKYFLDLRYTYSIVL